MSKRAVFVDSDVIISSLLSEKGAAYFLLNEQKDKFTISNLSKKELRKVADRLEIGQDKLESLTKGLKTIKLTQDLTKIKRDFEDYTSDVNDAHIVAGAVKAKAKFLLTYNIRHFKKHKINKDLGIVILTPAQYLQYLRSLE